MKDQNTPVLPSSTDSNFSSNISVQPEANKLITSVNSDKTCNSGISDLSLLSLQSPKNRQNLTDTHIPNEARKPVENHGMH